MSTRRRLLKAICCKFEIHPGRYPRINLRHFSSGGSMKRMRYEDAFSISVSGRFDNFGWRIIFPFLFTLYDFSQTLVPLTVSCWPSTTPAGTVLTVELEVTDTSKRLEDIRVSFMCPAQANPQVRCPPKATLHVLHRY